MKVKELLLMGANYSEIAKVLQRHPASIKNHVRSKGGKNEYDPNYKQQKSIISGYYSLRETKRIKDLLEEGISYELIAKDLRRTHGAIATHVFKNGGIENYDPQKACYSESFEQTNENPEKDNKIFEMYKLGVPAKEIVETMKTSHGYIRRVIEKTMKEILENKKEQVVSYPTLESKIDTILFQLQIFQETLEDIKNKGN